MNLRQARLAKGLTQQQVAAHIGINQNTYSYWETGRSRVDTAALPRLAALFGVSVDYLLGNAGEETPKGVKIPVLAAWLPAFPSKRWRIFSIMKKFLRIWAAQGEFFALQVKGRSMEPRMRKAILLSAKSRPTQKQGT